MRFSTSFAMALILAALCIAVSCDQTDTNEFARQARRGSVMRFGKRRVSASAESDAASYESTGQYDESDVGNFMKRRGSVLRFGKR